MLKKFILLLILLIPTIAAQAFSFTISSITTVMSTNGTCAPSDMLIVVTNSTFAATVNDGGDFDWFSFVLYDAYGTPLGNSNMAISLGVSGSIPGFAPTLQTAAAARPFSLKIFDTPSPQTAAAAANFRLLESVTFDPADYGFCDFLPYYEALPEGSIPQFTDGRLNSFDMAAPFVVYGHDFEDGRGLVVYSPEGNLLLTVSPADLATECTGETIELASANGVTLYLLPSCEYQINAASLDGTKTYVLIFNSPYPNTGYSSYEE